MKRVIDGKTYNTDTSTIVGRYEYENQNGCDVEATVYLNNGGAFFVLHHWEVGKDELARSKTYMEAMTREEIEKLVKDQDNFQIIDDEALQPPPEAEAESEPGATIYLRVPASLKKRVEEAAERQNSSTNAWTMRCIEEGLQLASADRAVKELILQHKAGGRDEREEVRR